MPTLKPARPISRILAPTQIFAAASELAASIAQLPMPLRQQRENALAKAVQELMQGCQIRRSGDGVFTVPSRTRKDQKYTVVVETGNSGSTCSCEAHVEQKHPCWHVEACQLLLAARATRGAPSPREVDDLARLLREVVATAIAEELASALAAYVPAPAAAQPATEAAQPEAQPATEPAQPEAQPAAEAEWRWWFEEAKEWRARERKLYGDNLIPLTLKEAKQLSIAELQKIASISADAVMQAEAEAEVTCE